MVGATHPRYNGQDLAEAFLFGVGQWRSAQSNNDTFAPGNGTAYFGFINLPKAGVQIDSVGVNVTSGGTAGVALCRIALYDDDGTGARPLGAPLVDAGTVDAGGGAIRQIVLGAAVTAKYPRIWAMGVTQGAPAALPSYRRWLGGSPFYVADLANVMASANNSQGWFMTGVTGAAPTIAPGTALTQANGGILVAVRRSA